MIGVMVTPEVKKLVIRMAEIKGISISEYARGLILKDLDNRGVFSLSGAHSQKEHSK